MWLILFHTLRTFFIFLLDWHFYFFFSEIPVYFLCTFFYSHFASFGLSTLQLKKQQQHIVGYFCPIILAGITQHFKCVMLI